MGNIHIHEEMCLIMDIRRLRSSNTYQKTALPTIKLHCGPFSWIRWNRRWATIPLPSFSTNPSGTRMDCIFLAQIEMNSFFSWDTSVKPPAVSLGTGVGRTWWVLFLEWRLHGAITCSSSIASLEVAAVDVYGGWRNKDCGDSTLLNLLSFIFECSTID